MPLTQALLVAHLVIGIAVDFGPVEYAEMIVRKGREKAAMSAACLILQVDHDTSQEALLPCMRLLLSVWLAKCLCIASFVNASSKSWFGGCQSQWLAS